MQIEPSFSSLHHPLKMVLLVTGIIFCFGLHLSSQATFEFNAFCDVEFSMAGKDSHYYYNGVDQEYTNPRIGVSQLSLQGKIHFDPQWSVSSRVLLERDRGKELRKVIVPQLNVQWLSKDRKFGITLGSFINPWGSFNEKQLSTDRNFIGLPLAYSYYHNISDKIGWVDGLGDIYKIPANNAVQWGTTNLYYGGYTTGMLFSWNINPSKVSWKLALVSGASNKQERFTNPLHLGVISKLKTQPTYFWEQGFSISHGSFLQSSEITEQLDNLRAYTQTIIGTDYKLGAGYFEFSGELMGVFYTTAEYNGENEMYESGTDGRKVIKRLGNYAAYLDVKYEPPILQGSFLAYRIDYLGFGNSGESTNQSWDNNVLRHSLAIGYNINQFLLARLAFSTQQVDQKTWNRTQGTIRFVLTAHY